MSEVAEMRRGPAGSVRSEPRTEPNGAPFMKGWAGSYFATAHNLCRFIQRLGWVEGQGSWMRDRGGALERNLLTCRARVARVRPDPGTRKPQNLNNLKPYIEV